MNMRTHLTLVPAIDDGPPARARHAMPRRGTTAHRPPGGRAAGAAALAAGLTLGLALGAVATLVTHPGTFGTLLLPVVGAAALTLAAAFRSRQVAQRRRHAARVRREREQERQRALLPKPVLVHSRSDFRPVLVPDESVATPIRRAA
ncbi:MAG: hypothetical protein ACPHP1_08620 [Miltoncostaeaceae bacterium]